MSELGLVIRRRIPGDDDDLIYNSWIKCLGQYDPFSKLDRSWYSTAQHGVISKLLGVSDVYIAQHQTYEDQIYGYLVGDSERRLLHWVYTKAPFRKAHVATRLMNHAYGDYTHPVEITVKTPAISHHIERWNLEYRPYGIRTAITGE